ncbi:hypothetical protein BD410DRAFT_784299 [Rickenella mellea]|uniref:Uncharacterized protein n=1 Tax=Rickenella mellea TaxID=50990 RepID=A0A4Y7QG56_9AGAM|nr:hypothetical protein BD410DRAFT_784299 [Rickenella mellea]
MPHHRRRSNAVTFSNIPQLSHRPVGHEAAMSSTKRTIFTYAKPPRDMRSVNGSDKHQPHISRDYKIIEFTRNDEACLDEPRHRQCQHNAMLSSKDTTHDPTSVLQTETDTSATVCGHRLGSPHVTQGPAGSRAARHLSGIPGPLRASWPHAGVTSSQLRRTNYLLRFAEPPAPYTAIGKGLPTRREHHLATMQDTLRTCSTPSKPRSISGTDVFEIQRHKILRGRRSRVSSVPCNPGHFRHPIDTETFAGGGLTSNMIENRTRAVSRRSSRTSNEFQFDLDHRAEDQHMRTYSRSGTFSQGSDHHQFPAVCSGEFPSGGSRSAQSANPLTRQSSTESNFSIVIEPVHENLRCISPPMSIRHVGYDELPPRISTILKDRSSVITLPQGKRSKAPEYIYHQDVVDVLNVLRVVECN